MNTVGSLTTYTSATAAPDTDTTSVTNAGYVTPRDFMYEVNIKECPDSPIKNIKIKFDYTKIIVPVVSIV